MAIIKNTTFVEFVRSNKGMAFCKVTVEVTRKSKLDHKNNYVHVLNMKKGEKTAKFEML